MPEYTAYVSRVGWENKQWAFVHHYKRDPLESHSWVEVSHCALQWERNSGFWSYHSPGSGVFVNLGKTVSFQLHDDAGRFFRVSDADTRPLPPADDLNRCNFSRSRPFPKQYRVNYAALNARAMEEGYDSIQFLTWYDTPCGNLAIEIMHVGFDGNNNCGPAMRMGWGGTRSCNCRPDSYGCASCTATIG